MNIPLRQFLLLAVNNFEGWILVNPAIAVEALAEDPQQALIYVEKPEPKDGKTIWKLWRRSDWDLLQHQQQIKYKNWQEKKAVWDKLERNLKMLTTAIVKQTGVDMETAKQIAHKIISKTPHRAKNFDIELEL